MGTLKHMTFSTLLLTLIVCTQANKADARIKPTPIFPSNGTVLGNGCENRSKDIIWKFRWTEPILGTTRYHLYVIGPNAEIPLLDRSDITSTTYTDTSSGSYIANQNTRGWRWKVRALMNGIWSDWSEERAFDVEPLNTACR